MRKYFCTLIILYLFSIGCHFDSNIHCLKFANKYRNEDFTQFTNIGLAIRCYCKEGITIYISDKLDSKERRYPYMVIFNEGEESIKKTTCTMLKDSCAFDTIKLNKLALIFLKYHVEKLSVDKDNNVFIGIGSSEGANLVRFSDNKYVKDEYKKDWYSLDDNWYVKKD